MVDGDLPTGAVTFLFTDVAGSTRLWEDEPQAMGAAMAAHDALVESTIGAGGGRLVRPRGEGDSRFAVFNSPRDALSAAAALSLALHGQEWATAEPIRVRMAIATGEADLRAGDYYGDVVNRCARLRGIAHPGQVLVASATAQMVTSLGVPDGLSLADLGEHRMKDLSRPERVFQLNHINRPTSFPALLSLDRAKHNLPVQLSSFVGRDDDVAAVRTLVEQHRLVTVTGFGGMGKTRLALQVAAELADGDGDGVWFVDLSAETDPDRLAPAIAEALGVSESGDGPGPAVLRALVDQRVLLVLDNLEQILAATRFIADLLAAAPQVHVLATSREPLRIRGEREYALQPLAVGAGDPDVLGSYAAVRLFIDRAVASKHDFAVTNATAPAVAAICERLGGHPLSIELAAARVKVLTPDALLARLDTALMVLTGGGRDRPERHQTIRATIVWSYELLSEAEQRLLAAMSVFPGTATLEAIEAICGPAVGADLDLLDGIASLTDKSLVRVHEPDDESPETRYSLLVPVREYAAEQLQFAGEADATGWRHARFYEALQAPVLDETPEHGYVQERTVIRELHNLRAALRFVQDHGSVNAEAGFVDGTFVAELVQMGSFDEAAGIAERVIAQAKGATRASAFAHYHLAWVHELSARTELGRAEMAASLEDARSAGAASLAAVAAISVFRFAVGWRDLMAALDIASQAVEAVPSTGNWPARWNLDQLWNYALATTLGYVDPERAIQAAIATRDALGTESYPADIAQSCAELGVLLVSQGRIAEAMQQIEPVWALVRGNGLTELERATVVRSLAYVQLGAGRLAEAVETATWACELADQLGVPAYRSGSYTMLADCCFADGALPRAATELEQAIGAVVSAADPLRLGAAEWRLARVRRLIGTADPELLESAWRHLAGTEVQRLPDVLGCMVERAIHLADSDSVEAAHLIGLVQAHRKSFVLPVGVADEIDPLLTELRRLLGKHRVDAILADVADEPLPGADAVL
ncbi:MAG TPA: AAA family ATPase [Mycobacteriales bacterium]|nr:AAA family ATPase [Mycobacteriales bacterium]